MHETKTEKSSAADAIAASDSGRKDISQDLATEIQNLSRILFLLKMPEEKKIKFIFWLIELIEMLKHSESI